jgi:hypothetical protein
MYLSRVFVMNKKGFMGLTTGVSSLLIGKFLGLSKAGA